MDIKPEIFVTYCLDEDVSEDRQFISHAKDKILLHFNQLNWKVISNNVNIENSGNITSYLTNSCLGKYIVIILNKKYLTNYASLCEIQQIIDSGFSFQYIFPIVLPDVKIFANIQLIDYYFYWNDLIIDAQKRLEKVVNPIFKNQLISQIECYSAASKFVSNLSAFSQNFVIRDYLNTNFLNELTLTIVNIAKNDAEKVLFDNRPEYINRCPYYIYKNLIGRTEVLDLIDKEIITKKSIFLASNIPGVGKTTLAKAYINHEKYYKKFNHIAWITVANNLQTNFIDQLTDNPETPFESEQDNYSNFKFLLKELQKFDGTNLLVIDNANNQEEINEIKNDLDNLNWKILYISQTLYKGDDTIILENLSTEDSRKLFYRHYRKEQNDKILNYLLQQIQNHTLLVELLAKVASHNPRMNIIKIYELIQKIKFRSLQIGNLDQQAQTADEENFAIQMQLYSVILATFEMESFTDEEEGLLRYFSVLPPYEISEKNLIQYCLVAKKNIPDFMNTLNHLVNKGWLQNNYDTYSVHVLIRPVLLYKLNPSGENCYDIIRYFTEKLSTFDIQELNEKRKYLPYAESFINSITEPHFNLAKLAEKIAELFLSFENYNKALDYRLKALNIKEKLLDKNDLDVAKGYNDVSIIYNLLGNYEKDLEYGLHALEIRKTVLNSTHPELAESYNNVAITYRYLGDYAKAIEYHQKDIEISEKNQDGSQTNLAMSFYEISITYYYQKDYNNAAHYIDKAVEIWKKTLDSNHSDYKNALDIQNIIHRKNENELTKKV